MARGMVRRASKVCIQYPACPSYPSRAAAPCKPPQEAGHESQPKSAEASPCRPRKSASAKNVSWADEPSPAEGERMLPKLVSSMSAEDGTPTEALERSMKIMDSLYDLRRVSVSLALTDSGPLPSPAEGQEAAEDLLHSTLKELDDTEASLRALEAQLSLGQGSVSDYGGSRHATAVVSGRTLAVVRRKMSLLHDVEARHAEFSGAQGKADEYLPLVVAGSLCAPPGLAGIRKFIASYTHGNGGPANANRSSFVSFASTFKLPSEHQALEQLRNVADAAGEWWADACLDEASKGAEHIVLRRLFDVALSTGVDINHPKLVRATRILIDRLAERVRKEAKEMLRLDTERAERCEGLMQVGPAAHAADKIEQAMLLAVKEGVPSSDPRLKEAEEIVKALRQLDGERKRLWARQKRLEEQARAREEPKGRPL